MRVLILGAIGMIGQGVWPECLSAPDVDSVLVAGDGMVSKTSSYRLMYAVMAPLYPLWKRLMPNQVTSTRQLGQAMLQVTRNGFAKEILESADFNVAAQ